MKVKVITESGPEERDGYWACGKVDTLDGGERNYIGPRRLLPVLQDNERMAETIDGTIHVFKTYIGAPS